MHNTNKYSQRSPIIWPVWLNGWVFVYELITSCGFESALSLAKVNFDVRMKEEAKSLASKSQEDSALDIADNREKIEKKIEKK